MVSQIVEFFLFLTTCSSNTVRATLTICIGLHIYCVLKRQTNLAFYLYLESGLEMSRLDQAVISLQAAPRVLSPAAQLHRQ